MTLLGAPRRTTRTERPSSAGPTGRHDESAPRAYPVVFHYAAVSVFIVFAVLVPVSVLAANEADPPVLAVGLQTFLCVYSAGRLAELIWQGRLAPLATVFWIFIFVAVGVAPLCQLSLGRSEELADTDLTGSWLVAQMITITAVLGYELGRLRLSPTRRRRAHRALRLSMLRWLTVAAVVTSSGYVALAGPSSFFTSREGLTDSFSDAGLQADGSQVTSALLTSLGSVPCLVALLGWVWVLRRHPELRTMPHWMVVVVLSVVNVVVNNPISNSRYWFLTVLLGLLFSLVRSTRGVFLALIVGAVVSATLLFPYSDYFRTEDPTRASFSSSSPALALATKDYDQMVMTANGVAYVATEGHTWGRQLTGAALFWLPRSAWADKPMDSGVVLGEWLLSANVNLSSPFWLELWLDFSWPGVVLGMAALGRASVLLDRFFESAVGNGNIAAASVPPAVLLVPLLAGYEFIILRGPLLQAMGRLVVLMLVLVVIFRRGLTGGSRA